MQNVIISALHLKKHVYGLFWCRTLLFNEHELEIKMRQPGSIYQNMDKTISLVGKM